MSSPEAPDTDRSAWLSDTALSALALHEQPFAPGAAGGEAFADDVTAEQLADIRQALITGDDLLLILGEAGAGKSTLLTQLAANSGLRIQCFSVDGGPRFSTRNLFMGMLEAFKVEPSEDLKETLDELIPCLQAMVGNNKLCVVVLDDAQALAANELTTLLSGMLYINSRDESLLRIALAAPPAFEDRIPDLLPEGADLPYSSLSLEPFDAVRAGDYLGFRLARAGRDDELPFEEEELAALNERAGGRPGALHAAAAAALETAHGEPGAYPAGLGAHDALVDGTPPDADADLPPELREHRVQAGGGPLDGRVAKLALGALAGLLIVGGLLLFRTAPDPGETEARYRVVEERKVETSRETERLRLLRENEAREDEADTAPPADDGPVALAPAAGDDGPGPAPASAPDGAPSGVRAVDSSDAPSGPSSDDGPDTAADTTPTGGASAPDGDASASAGAAPGTSAGELDATDADAPGASASGAGPAERDASGATSPSSGAVADASAPAAATEAAAAADADAGGDPDATPSATPGAGTGTDAPDPASAPPSESPTAEDGAPAGDATDGGARSDVALLGTDEEASPVEPEPVPNGVLESPNWVLVQNPDRYTVQMSASTERATVEAFLARTDLPAPNSIFSFDRDGTTWYALVHGLFPSIAEARGAIERMAPPAQANQPWIRAVGRIQEALRE